MLHMYILSSVLGVSMPTFSYLFVALSGDVEGAKYKTLHIDTYLIMKTVQHTYLIMKSSDTNIF